MSGLSSSRNTQTSCEYRNRRTGRSVLSSSRVGAAIVVMSVVLAGCSMRPASHPPSRPARPPQVAEAPLQQLLDAAGQIQRELFPDIERRIGTCMRERGFEYRVQPVSVLDSAAPADRLDRDTFRERFGYGILARLRHPKMFRASRIRDVNRRMLRDLSESERRDHGNALYGTRAGRRRLRAADGSVVATIFPQSCVAKAQATVHGPQGPYVRASVRLNDVLAKVNSRVSDDGSIDAAETQWSRCVAARAGEIFDEPGEIPEAISARLGQLRASDASLDDPASWPPAVEELEATELYLAGVDGECRTDSGLDAAVARERACVEGRFVRRHARLIGRVWLLDRAVVRRAAMGIAACSAPETPAG